MSIGWILLSALLSALFTLAAVAVWARFYFQPRLRGRLQQDLDEQVENAAQVLAERVEEAVRRGLIEGVSSLPSREVLEGASRSLARSSVDLVGDRLGQLFGLNEKEEK